MMTRHGQIWGRAGLALTAMIFAEGAALAEHRGGNHGFPASFGAPAVPGQPASAHNAEALLRQMLVAENNLTVAGTQETLVSGGATSEQHILRRGAHALRLDYDRPPQMRGEQIVDNGQTYYHLRPRQNRVETQPSQVNSLRVRVPQVIRQIRQGELLVQWVGQDTVAGHACDIVDVTAREGAPAARRRFWIDPTNGAQLKIEQYNAQGQLLSVSYYTSVTYDPPLNAHSFDPPQAPTTAVPASNNQQTVPTPAEVGFTVLQPSFLPPGFHWQSAGVTEYRGKKVAILRYTNGLGLVSVFETPDNGRGPSDKRPHPNVLVSRRSGLKIIVVGSVDANTQESVVNSLR